MFLASCILYLTPCYMILIIDTTDSKIIKLILAQGVGDFVVQEIAGEYKQSEKLLVSINNILRKNKIDRQDLKQIGVVSGPGGFTSLRIGVVVANTLAYALSVSVVGINKTDYKNDEELVKQVLNYKSNKKKLNIVMPKYGSEPNIG